MLDVTLFRTDQGGNPDLVRESQRRRYADVSLVDKVIELDSAWRSARSSVDLAKKEKNANQKKIGEFMKKKETPPAELLQAKQDCEAKIAELEAKEKELIAQRDATIGSIGNLVPDDVPVDDNEDNNEDHHDNNYQHSSPASSLASLPRARAYARQARAWLALHRPISWCIAAPSALTTAREMRAACGAS